MTARLRIVLDQLVTPNDPDLAAASRSVAEALVATTPSGCDVAAILPAAAQGRQDTLLDGLVDVWRAPAAQPTLAQAWRYGIPLGAAGGMVHSPTLAAPLVRHDRAHNHDQTVVTMWSLDAWRAPARMSRGEAAWQRGMLRRATRYADAVVVPTHAMANDLAEIASLRGRVRVIAGAPPAGFRNPTDSAGRLRSFALPERFIVVLADVLDLESLSSAIRAAVPLNIDVVVIIDERAESARVAGVATAAGISEHRLRVLPALESLDRASLLTAAIAVVAASESSAFPWRALEALAVGAPLIVAATLQNEEIFSDGARLTAIRDSDAIGAELVRLLEDETLVLRQGVLSTDRARAFSWTEAANRIWQLHAEL